MLEIGGYKNFQMAHLKFRLIKSSQRNNEEFIGTIGQLFKKIKFLGEQFSNFFQPSISSLRFKTVFNKLFTVSKNTLLESKD